MISTLRHWRDRWRHPQRYQWLDELLQAQGLSHEQLRYEQQQRFNAIVRYAASHTDFYASRLAAEALNATDVDPRDLPILTKQDVRKHLTEMLGRDNDRSRVKTGHTGGSTGTPLAFYYDDSKHERMLAGMKRGFMLSGWRPGQRVLYLWGASRDVSGRGVFAHAGTGLFDCETSLAAVEYSEARLASWCGLIRRWQPVLLYGYASALGELARFVIETGAVVPGSLIGVYSTAEVLHEGQRELIQQAFGCQVFNQYGCREVPNIAWECRAGNMHVFSDIVKLESAPGDDGYGRLLVTSLGDRVMPFIRYDTGDSGRLLEGRCDCGLPFPLMQMDLCRHNDLITTCAGKRLHPSLFNGLLYGLMQVRRYQWVQTACDHMQLRLVSDAPLSHEALQGIESRLCVVAGAQMRLDVSYVDDIEPTVSGKHRFVIALSGR